jgi:hypothetical protein
MSLLSPEPTLLDKYRESPNRPTGDQFDLVTFPEAFLPAEDFTRALDQLALLQNFGCVHVGLRPTSSVNTHLFSVAEFDSLIATLLAIPAIDRDDIVPVKSWLSRQDKASRFNVGALFAIDAKGKLRVCLHPKMVRSRYEMHPLEERHMAEANLLTLITLLPEDKIYLSVTLQPLLCSDALQLDTDHPGRLPLDGVNTGAQCFERPPPDHIDIVSVATCTPQPETARNDRTKYRQWHQHFRTTFQRVGEGGSLARHYHCTFVLSNFHKLSVDPHALPGDVLGGLSGAFIPVPMGSEHLPSFAQLSSFGRLHAARGDDNLWSIPDEKIDQSRATRGYIAQLSPYDAEPVVAKLLGFTIIRFPRDAPRWRPQPGLADFRLRTAVYDKDGNVITAERGEP